MGDRSQTLGDRPLGAVMEELLRLPGGTADAADVAGELPYMECVLTTEHEGMRYVLLRGPPPPERCRSALSSRELEIASMIARGHTTRTIATILEISPWTVSTHLRRIFAKLDVRSRPAMIAKLVHDRVLAP